MHEFSLSSDRCIIQVTCVTRVLDFYIHPSNNHGYVLLTTLMFWCRSRSSWHCCVPFIVLESAVSWEFYWPGVVYRWLLRLRPGSKFFLAASSPIFTWGGPKYHQSLYFMYMVPHGTWCWYWVVKDFDENGSYESCLHNAFRNPRKSHEISVADILFL